jgi:hypothetical protein
MTQSLTIINRMATVLTGTLPNAIVVNTDRVGSYDRDEMPYVLVTPESEETQRHDSVYDMTTLIVDVEIGVRASSWKSAADAYADAINVLLMADATLKTLMVRLRRHGKKWDANEADMTAGTLTLSYDVMYLSLITQI